MSNTDFFKLVFDRKPKDPSKEPDFNRTVKALEKALEEMVKKDGGEIPRRAEDEAPRVI